jgi:hypothetical protein
MLPVGGHNWQFKNTKKKIGIDVEKVKILLIIGSIQYVRMSLISKLAWNIFGQKFTGSSMWL